MLNGLQYHLIPCPLKYLTGLDCPLCGFQRSVISILKGNVYQSLILYPPAIPVLILLTYFAVGSFVKFDRGPIALKRSLAIAVTLIVIVNYGFKLWMIYNHHQAVSAPAAM